MSDAVSQITISDTCVVRVVKGDTRTSYQLMYKRQGEFFRADVILTIKHPNIYEWKIVERELSYLSVVKEITEYFNDPLSPTEDELTLVELEHGVDCRPLLGVEKKVCDVNYRE